MQREKIFYDYSYGYIRVAFGKEYSVWNGKKIIPVYIKYRKGLRQMKLEGRYILYREKKGKWRLPGQLPLQWYIRISEMYTDEEIQQIFQHAIASASVTKFRASN